MRVLTQILTQNYRLPLRFIIPIRSDESVTITDANATLRSSDHWRMHDKYKCFAVKKLSFTPAICHSHT